MSKFNCTTPWGPEKDYICTNETIGLMAQKLYNDYFKYQNASRLKHCPKSCILMKMRPGNGDKSFQNLMYGKRSGTIAFNLNEIITVTTDSYSYIWLNFVAEVGGYVGLFLGYSVYQVTDILEKILPRKLF